MPRPRTPVPSYRLHKPSGQAIITVRKPEGGRRDIYLGTYGSPESRAEYERVLAELRAALTPEVGPNTPPADLTVNEVLLAFWAHGERHYRHPDGTPTSELDEYRLSLKPVRELYGHTLARAFGPLALKAVRQRMVGAGLCRTLVNKRVGRTPGRSAVGGRRRVEAGGRRGVGRPTGMNPATTHPSRASGRRNPGRLHTRGRVSE